MKLALAIVAALAAVARAGGPVDPAKLDPIATKPGGHGEPTLVFAAGVPPDDILRLVDGENLIVVSSGTLLAGRVGEPGGKGVPSSAIVDALLAGRDHASPGGGAGSHDTVDLDFRGAQLLDLLRLLAAVHHTNVVVALSVPPPPLTIKVRRADTVAVTRAVVKLVGVQLVETSNAWIVVDRDAVVDRKLAARTSPGLELRTYEATAAEVQMLLDPSATATAPCTSPLSFTANIHRGATGAFEAAIATLHGKPCEVAMYTGKIDLGDMKLVATLVQDKVRRAVLRGSHGVRRVEIGTEITDITSDIVTYKSFDGREHTITTFPDDGTRSLDRPGTHDPIVDTPSNYRLAATLRTGKRWRALFVDKSGRSYERDDRASYGMHAFRVDAHSAESDGAHFDLTSAP